MYVDHTVTLYEATFYKAFHAKYTTLLRCISILYGVTQSRWCRYSAVADIAVS